MVWIKDYLGEMLSETETPMIPTESHNLKKYAYNDSISGTIIFYILSTFK